MSKIIVLKKDQIQIKINVNNGQLISVSKNRKEYMHNGGSDSFNGKGWNNSEIIPFPIFGPAYEQKVHIKKNTYNLEQHGISRHTNENPFILKEIKKEEITLIQNYTGNKIKNPKYTKQKPKYLSWMPYSLEKTFTLTEKGITCTLRLTNTSKHNMPYCIGWHPAFKVQGNSSNSVFTTKTGNTIITLHKVIEHATTHGTAIILKNKKSLTYIDKKSGKGIHISSKDFHNGVLVWSPNSKGKMFCIEFVSQLPLLEGKGYFKNQDSFESLNPNESKTYTITIEVF